MEYNENSWLYNMNNLKVPAKMLVLKIRFLKFLGNLRNSVFHRTADSVFHDSN